VAPASCPRATRVSLVRVAGILPALFAGGGPASDSTVPSRRGKLMSHVYRFTKPAAGPPAQPPPAARVTPHVI